MFAPNRTASMNGSALTPSWFAILIAIGVPIAAAALFDTMLVMIVIRSRNALSIIGGGNADAALTNDSAMKSAMPVPSSALPSASAVTMIMTTGMDNDVAASRQPGRRAP